MAMNGKAVAKAVAVLGPFVPKAIELIKNNPEIWETVQREAKRLSRKDAPGPEGVLGTLRVLREQVDYLESSADDSDETHRAQAWKKRLDHTERAAQLLRGGSASKQEVQALQARVEELRSEIFAAFITEQSEDAGLDR